jgi:hypothetical protein
VNFSHTRRSHRSLFALVAVLLFPGLLAACGDDADTSADDTPSTSATTASTSTSSTTSTTTAAGAVALAQTCRADRYTVGYPAGWTTNPGKVVPLCRFFHPEPFTVPEGTEVVDRAVILDVESVPFARMAESIGGPSEEVLSQRALAVSDRSALRVEVRSTDGLLPRGTPSLRYMIDLGDATLVAVTHGVEGADHERNRIVLEAMVASLVIPDGENCSAAALPTEPTRQDLPGPVAEMRRSIVAAATACEFDRLADLARTGSFTHSFGDSGDPARFWRRAEDDGEPLAVLVHFLNQPSATRPAGDVTQYVWPRAYSYESWTAVPAEAREELRPIYGTEDFKRFERFGSYNGFRVGITGGGDWIFFVGGD